MRFGLLGTLEVVDDEGRPVDVGGLQARVVLAALLAAAGRVVTADALIEAVWGDQIPASAAGTLQSYISRLRKELEPDRARGAPPALLLFEPPGYRLAAGVDDVDFRRFEALADAGRNALAAGKDDEARQTLLEADALWRGSALVEFLDHEFGAGLAARLEDRRLAAAEDRVEAELRLGRHDTIVGELAELVRANPLRERLQGQLALALYRSGRQAEALRALASAGQTLREELGVEPSKQLRDLEAAILDQDAALDPSVVAPLVAVADEAPSTIFPGGDGAPTPSRLQPLVGRDDELRVLRRAYDEAAGDSRFVVIEGEPGIGKTRLAEEIRTLAVERGGVAAWGRSDEGGAAPALWPWLIPLRALAERADHVAASLAELLSGDAPMLAGQAQAVQFERFTAVAELLERVGRSQTAVVLLDDLQWADETSLDLLAFLASRVDRGALVVATVRQLELGRNDAVTRALAAIARRPGSRRLVLRGLAEQSTAALLEDASIASDVVRAIHDRAEGNPFYALELSRLATEEGGLHGEVPGSVGDVVRRRLSRLTDSTVELLRVGAVVGRDVDLELLAAAAGRPLDEVLDDADAAVAHRLLLSVPEQPGVLRFSHALVREVLLEDLTPLRRARLHLRVADAIEARGAGTDEAEILAQHLWQAAPVGVGRRAAEALERAAEVSIRRVAYGAAEDLLTKACQLRRATGSSPEDQEAELRAIFRLLEVARARRYFQGAAGLVELHRAKELAERLGHRERLVELIWIEWSAFATASMIEPATALARAYVELTAEDRPEVAWNADQVQGVLAWMRGRIAEANERLEDALAALAHLPPPANEFNAEARMVTQTFSLWMHLVTGKVEPDGVWASYDQMLQVMQEDRFATSSICGFAATAALAIGDWEQAGRYADVGTAADPSAQFAFWGGQARMQHGVVLAWRGDVDAGVETFLDGRRRYLEVGAYSGKPTFEASLAITAAAQGRLDVAERFVGDARASLDARHEGWNEAPVAIAEAIVASELGDTERAAERLASAVTVATEQGATTFVRRAEAVAAELQVG